MGKMLNADMKASVFHNPQNQADGFKSKLGTNIHRTLLDHMNHTIEYKKGLGLGHLHSLISMQKRLQVSSFQFWRPKLVP